MPDFLPRFSAASQNSSESWLSRVCSNAQQLAHRTGLSLSSALGAPLHLLDLRRGSLLGRAQYGSMLTHAAIILALPFGLFIPPRKNHRVHQQATLRVN
jgi:hypothetical protein